MTGPSHVLYLYAFVIGFHGKKSPCFECHVEVHGTGEHIFVYNLVGVDGVLTIFKVQKYVENQLDSTIERCMI